MDTASKPRCSVGPGATATRPDALSGHERIDEPAFERRSYHGQLLKRILNRRIQLPEPGQTPLHDGARDPLAKMPSSSSSWTKNGFPEVSANRPSASTELPALSCRTAAGESRPSGR